MNQIKLSVILPSLNVAPYISECIESVMNQSLRDIEIICVDAGSTDGTLELLKEHQNRDNRIKVLISDKKSYGYQMNMGIDAATGEYIGIVETDDYAPKDMYEQLYYIAARHDLDFIKSDFFRFTGEGKTLKKVYHRLCFDRSFYNRVIDVSREQECFRFIMNTWCGIYKRDYLIKHGIRHNETPGASYQDNGFWFQTLMYAKRAYFLDRPFYMNRRDNPGSSVHSKDKAFCICDEYDFIWEILNRDKAIFEIFKHSYSYACFQAYRANFFRIASKYRHDFFQKFAERFRELENLHAVDVALYSKEECKTLAGMRNNHEACYAQWKAQSDELLSRAQRHDMVIIYGAGMIGKQVLYDLQEQGFDMKKVSFAVSVPENNFSEFQGIKIHSIDELLDCRETALVLVAVTQKYQMEIKETIERMGFINSWTVPVI